MDEEREEGEEEKRVHDLREMSRFELSRNLRVGFVALVNWRGATGVTAVTCSSGNLSTMITFVLILESETQHKEILHYH